MKKWLYYGAGVITGVVLVFLFAFITRQDRTEDSGIRYYDKPGEVVEQRSFQVFQVIADNAALAHGKDSDNDFMGPIYVLTNSEGKLYYDEEIVKVPKDKVVRAMGTYTYPTKNGFEKTVLIVRFMDE